MSNFISKLRCAMEPSCTWYMREATYFKLAVDLHLMV